MAKPIVKQNIETINTNLGNMTSLTTQDKTSLVNAVNENVGKITVLSDDRGYLESRSYVGNLDDLKTNGMYFVQGTSQNSPFEGFTGSILVIDRSKVRVTQIASENATNANTIFTRTFNGNNSWSAWKQLATTETIELQMPIQSNLKPIDGTQLVIRKINNVCYVWGRITKKDGTDWVNETICASLPVGYRPVGGVLLASHGSYTKSGTYAYIDSSGVFIANTLSAGAGIKEIWFSGSWVAY